MEHVGTTKTYMYKYVAKATHKEAILIVHLCGRVGRNDASRGAAVGELAVMLEYQMLFCRH